MRNVIARTFRANTVLLGIRFIHTEIETLESRGSNLTTPVSFSGTCVSKEQRK